MECRIRKHDNRQLEVKLAYPLRRDEARSHHRLEMFLFFPYSLDMDARTWPRERFYEDLLTYTRFKTPELSSPDLLDEKNPESPMNRIRAILDKGGKSAGDITRLKYEIPMLANMIRVNIRDARQRAGKQLVHILPAELPGLIGEVRRLFAEVEHASMSEEVTKSAQWADEYISCQVEDALLRLLQSAMLPESNASPDEIKQLRAILEEESAHRKNSGYPLRRGDDLENERYVYREGLLKKFCSAVLYLSVQHRKATHPAQHLLFAVAAGLAGGAAVVAAWFFGGMFPQNSLQLLIVLTVAYILKDRIKDMARASLLRIMPRWFSDRTAALKDPRAGGKIGKTSERMRWVRPEELPPEITEARKYLSKLERHLAHSREMVLRYEKEIRIDNRAIYRNHQRTAAIDDIMRLQAHQWLQRMDDPREWLLRLNGNVERAAVKRIYRVNMVIRLSSKSGGDVLIKSVRLALTKNGIERIEHGNILKEKR